MCHPSSRVRSDVHSVIQHYERDRRTIANHSLRKRDGLLNAVRFSDCEFVLIYADILQRQTFDWNSSELLRLLLVLRYVIKIDNSHNRYFAASSQISFTFFRLPGICRVKQ